MNYHIIAFRVRDITNFGRGVILFFSLLYKKNASTDICKITNVKICTLFDSSSINLQILFLFYIRFNTILIEIKKNTQLKEIALKIHKDPTTISKEVKLHRICKKYNLSSFVTCGYNCKYYQNCNIKHLCGQNKCNFLCKACKNINCNKKCEKFEPYECKRLKRFPYVCNGCDKIQGCKRNERYYYDSSIANNEYKEILVESRNGIDTDTQSFKVLDSIMLISKKNDKDIGKLIDKK